MNEEVIILFIVSHRFNISIFKVRKYIVYFYNFIICISEDAMVMAKFVYILERTLLFNRQRY